MNSFGWRRGAERDGKTPVYLVTRRSGDGHVRLFGYADVRFDGLAGEVDPILRQRLDDVLGCSALVVRSGKAFEAGQRVNVRFEFRAVDLLDTLCLGRPVDRIDHG